MFVPQGWGHSTLNLRESIGVANFFLDEDAVGYRPTKLFHSSRGIRSLQTAAGILGLGWILDGWMVGWLGV